jgi:hypothetical protein
MSHKQDATPDRKAKVVAAWMGFAFTVVAVLGFALARGVWLLWTVLLIWGLATIPQVLMWREPARKEARERSRDSGS